MFKKNIVSIILLLSFNTFGQAPQETFIVGGREALDEEFPWMVELIANNEHHCGGALIAPNWVVTAAHCIKAGFGAPVPDRVIINNINRATAESFSEEIDIDELKDFPGFVYGSFTGGDIGLVRLNSSSAMPLLPINDVDSNIVAIGDSVFTMGWGISTPGGSLLPKLKVSNPLIKTVEPQVIHAGFDTGEAEEGSAAGDSGGPLIVKTPDGYKLLGVVSGGAGLTTTAGSPGIFTRILAYTNWIDSVMISEPVGINEEINEAIKIYQEDQKTLTIFHSGNFPNKTNYSIVNISGQILLNGVLDETSSIQNIDISKLNIGTHFLRISNKSNTSFKFLKIN